METINYFPDKGYNFLKANICNVDLKILFKSGMQLINIVPDRVPLMKVYRLLVQTLFIDCVTGKMVVVEVDYRLLA